MSAYEAERGLRAVEWPPGGMTRWGLRAEKATRDAGEYRLAYGMTDGKVRTVTIGTRPDVLNDLHDELRGTRHGR